MTRPRPADPASPSGDGDGDISAVVGAALRRQRRAHGLTLVELAGRAGVSQPFLSQIERGQATPSLLTLYRVAEALGIKPTDLVPSPQDGAIERVPAAPRMVAARSGAFMAATEDPDSPVGRLISAGQGAGIELLEYTVDAAHNVADWYDNVPGESALFVLDGRLRIDVENGGTWELSNSDVLFYEGPVRTRWTALGSSPTRVLLVTSRPIGASARRTTPS